MPYHQVLGNRTAWITEERLKKIVDAILSWPDYQAWLKKKNKIKVEKIRSLDERLRTTSHWRNRQNKLRRGPYNREAIRKRKEKLKLLKNQNGKSLPS